MRVMIPVLALAAGVVLGMFLPVVLPYGLIHYVAVLILAILFALSALMKQEKVNYPIFISGFFIAVAFISFLIFGGEKLDLDIYPVCVLLLTAGVFRNCYSIFKRVTGGKNN